MTVISTGEPEVIKDIRCLEITSPFVNYKISPVPIPVDTYVIWIIFSLAFTFIQFNV